MTDTANAPEPLAFGKGELVIDFGTAFGRPAVFICKAKTPGVVGAPAASENNPTDRLQDGEIVLTFPTDEQAKLVADALVNDTSHHNEMRAELHLLKTSGIIEVAVRNPNVADYMEHWEGRAIKAETHCDELVAAAYVAASEKSWAIAVEMELHAAIGSTTKAKAEAIEGAILSGTPDNARAALTAYGERMKAEGAREAQAKIARLTEALEFYADDNRTGLPSDGPWGLGSNDFGSRARAALQENADG